MEENSPYITLLPGRNGYIIVKMIWNKALDMYQVAPPVEHKVYRDKAEAATRAITIGMEHRLEVRI